MKGGAHILLVDDDLASLNVHREVLDGVGFQVDIAQDGASALRACRDGQPQLVLLDLLMPGMDGSEVLQQLRKDARTRTIPVIALTGVPEWLLDHRDAAAEFDDILLKPLSCDRLIQAIYGLLVAPLQRCATLRRTTTAPAPPGDDPWIGAGTAATRR